MVMFETVTQLAIAFCIAVIAISLGAVLRRRPRTRLDHGQLAFLFDGGQLLNATRPARELLSASPAGGSDLQRLVDLLSPRFPDLPATLGALADLGQAQLRPHDGGSGTIFAEFSDGITRLTLDDSSDVAAAKTAETIRSKTIRDELELLRGIVDESTQLMWRTGADGQIVWANAAYLSMARRMNDDDAQPDQWPPKMIFQKVTADQPQSRHALLPRDAAEPQWFDVTALVSGAGHFFTAQDVTVAIRADDVSRDLMQTLTKTFAGFSVGLAVFDRSRQLVLFNPALPDITGLKPPSLIARPSIDSFLDLLRETRFLPEPRNYATWRSRMSDVEALAKRGDYSEDWQLPDGRTIRIAGRPFPGGAMALLFEDVTDQVAQLRDMTTALRLGSEIIDALPQAIAVFAPNGGELRLANAAFRALWPGGTLDHATLEHYCRRWRSDTQSQGWEQLIEQSYRPGGADLQFAARADGRPIQIKARNLSDGSLGIVFDPMPQTQQIEHATA